MTAPDLKLLRAFGNEDIYAAKLAGQGELVARLAMGLLGYGAGRSALSQQRSQQAEAEAMNAAFERMQAMQLQQAEAGARHTHTPLIIPAPVRGMSRWDGDAVPVGMDEGMVRLASVAYDVGADMAKEALSIEPLVDMAKNIFSKAAPALGKVMGGAAKPPAMPTLAAAAQKITGAVQAAPKPPPGIGQAAATLAGGAAGGGGLLGSLGSWGAKAQQGLQQSGITSLKGAAGTAAGLALGGAAIKGAVGGVKKGVGIMSQEASPAQFGSQQYGGSRVANGINEYGQPDLRTPFM